MKKLRLLLVSFLLLSMFCATAQNNIEKILFHVTTFFNSDGSTGLIGKTKFWQRNDVVIQEIYSIKTIKNGNLVETTYEPLLCRYIDLAKNHFYDFYSFSDTSACFKKGELNHLKSRDGGIRFYSPELVQMSSNPTLLSDTLIGDTIYKRVKYFSKTLDSTISFAVGLFPKGVKYSIFSLEQPFSMKNNWFMQKIFDYYYSNLHSPFAIREIQFVADKLSTHETQVFNAWEQYAREHPLK